MMMREFEGLRCSQQLSPSSSTGIDVDINLSFLARSEYVQSLLWN